VPTPERTCIGCRQKRERENLIRLVVGDGAVRIAGGRVHGRSAYLCPDVRCFEQAQHKKAFGRAFRTAAHVDGTLATAFVRTCESRRAVR
jgi:uncharacterized protein